MDAIRKRMLTFFGHVLHMKNNWLRKRTLAKFGNSKANLGGRKKRLKILI